MTDLHYDELLLEKLREEEEDDHGPRKVSPAIVELAKRLRESGPIELPKRQLSELEKRYP